jgi:hypothetical protein
VDTANAQGLCRSQPAPSIGVAAGVSAAYLEPASTIARAEPHSSVSVGGGAHLVGRAELPLTGPLRLRLEAARSHWDVSRTVYDPAAGYAVIDERSIGSMSARHLVALIGIPARRCTYVAAGGGVYSIGFRDASFRSPGFAVATGAELATGARGAIQIDGAVHLIGSRNGQAITSSDVFNVNIRVGWAYRF